MSPKTFITLLLRVLGILVLKELIVAVPQVIYQLIDFSRAYSVSDGLILLLISLLEVAVIISISFVLVYKAPVLIRKFALDHGIDEPELNVNLGMENVFRIAILVTGFVILVTEIPVFCRVCYKTIQQEKIAFFPDGKPDWSPVILSGVRVLLGFLIIGERKRILELLVRGTVSNNGTTASATDTQRIQDDKQEM